MTAKRKRQTVGERSLRYFERLGDKTWDWIAGKLEDGTYSTEMSETEWAKFFKIPAKDATRMLEHARIEMLMKKEQKK